MGIAALWGTGKYGGRGDSSLVGVGVGVGGFVGLPACLRACVVVSR